jgi:hypothetical protein
VALYTSGGDSGPRFSYRWHPAGVFASDFIFVVIPTEAAIRPTRDLLFVLLPNVTRASRRRLSLACAFRSQVAQTNPGCALASHCRPSRHKQKSDCKSQSMFPDDVSESVLLFVLLLNVALAPPAVFDLRCYRLRLMGRLASTAPVIFRSTRKYPLRPAP